MMLDAQSWNDERKKNVEAYKKEEELEMERNARRKGGSGADFVK